MGEKDSFRSDTNYKKAEKEHFINALLKAGLK